MTKFTCAAARLPLVPFLLLTLTFFASAGLHANSTSASLKKSHKGSVIGSDAALASVDGDVNVLLPDTRGNTAVVYAFNPATLSSVEGSRLVIDVFEQQSGSYKFSISGAQRRWIVIEDEFSCASSTMCTRFKANYELSGTLADYLRGNQVLLKIEARGMTDSRLVLDALSLEQADTGPTDVTTPLDAVSDRTTTNQGSSVTIAVLENDSSGAGASGIAIDTVTSPRSGSAIVSGRNIIYTPDSGFSGDDVFRYYASDSAGSSDSARVEVSVLPSTTDSGPVAAFSPGTTMYWQLQGAINTGFNADVFGIDLEDNENNGMIRRLQNSGKKVICYISAGSYEEWRSDRREFDLNNDIGNPLGDWPGEYYLDTNSDNVRRVMRSRIDRAVAAGCDALEPDNTDAYQANNGLGLTAADQIDYLRFLAGYAHSKGLSIGLKNTVDLIASADLADLFDWTLNESCYLYNECNSLKPFVAAGKAVYIAMYSTRSMSSRCSDAQSNNFHLAFYGSDYALDGSFYRTCP